MFKELKAIECALQMVGPLLVWHNIALFSDSTIVVRVLQNLYSKSRILRALLARIVLLLRRLGVKLQVHHIEGELN